MEISFVVDGRNKGHLMNVIRAYFVLCFSFNRFILNSVCNGLPKANLTNYPCMMSYTANKTGSWVVALKIEDFEFSSQTTPLSGTSIQFLVIVTPKTAKCTKGRKSFVLNRKNLLDSLSSAFLLRCKRTKYMYDCYCWNNDSRYRSVLIGLQPYHFVRGGNI